MKKIFYLAIIVILFNACSDEKSFNMEMAGHWMQKDFYEAVKAKKSLAEINVPMVELIIRAEDTGYTFITFGNKPKVAKIEIYQKNHMVIKDFYSRNQQADVKLINGEIHLMNTYTNEELVFVKLENVYTPVATNMHESYSIPYVHHQYISGVYQMDSIEVKFVDRGKLKGLDQFENFSFCYDPNCRTENANSIFLSNNIFEGNYYEFENRNDSLIIYDIDRMAIARGFKSKRMNVKYAMKKIN